MHKTHRAILWAYATKQVQIALTLIHTMLGQKKSAKVADSD